MSLRSRVSEIRSLGEQGKNTPLERDAQGRVVLLPKNVKILLLLVLAMIVVTVYMRVMLPVPQSGRGAGVAEGGMGSARTAQTPAGAAQAGPGLLPEGQYRVFYAPDRNLEGADIEAVNTAKQTVDAALYSATDPGFCDALGRAATRGVHVRVYRDAGQVSEEAGRAGEACGSGLVRAGVLVRVKAPGSDLMHLKSYAVDGNLLRTGSANLSVSGEKFQDNDAVFLGSASAARGFTTEFERMWSRPDNTALAGDASVR